MQNQPFKVSHRRLHEWKFVSLANRDFAGLVSTKPRRTETPQFRAGRNKGAGIAGNCASRSSLIEACYLLDRNCHDVVHMTADIRAVGKTGADDLLDAFSGITTQLIEQCDFPLNGAPVDPNDVWVQFDCRLVPQDTSGSPTTGDGWALDWTREPPHLVVGGAVCDALMAVGTVNADIAYNCHLGLQ